MNRELKKWLSNCIPPVRPKIYMFNWSVFRVKYNPTRVELFIDSDGLVKIVLRNYEPGCYDESMEFVLENTDWSKKEVMRKIMGVFAIIEVTDA